MLFLESDFSVKILSVQKLSWSYNNTQVKPRPYNAISFRLKGNSYFSNGETEINLTDGDILFMPKGVGYHLKSETEEIVVIHFDLEGKNQNNFELIRPRHPDRYEEIFNEIYNEWNNRNEGYYLKSMSIIYKLFARLSNHFTGSDNPAYIKIKKSVEFLNKNFTDSNINVNTLCNLSNISDTYFRKMFFEIYNTTPIMHLNRLRINYAVELLETGYYSIETISEKCGFTDSKYFSTVFKKYIGQSPANYKKIN